MLPWQMNNTFIIVAFLLNLPGNSLFARVFGCFMSYSEMTEYSGKSEQSLANYYYLLVVNLVVKENCLLLRIIHQSFNKI